MKTCDTTALRLITILLTLAISGCATTTDRIALNYTPRQNVAKIAGASDVAVSVQVTDQRQDKSKVSMKKTGFELEMTPVYALEEVAVTVRTAIEKELRALGFQTSPAGALVQIAADLTRFFNEFKQGFFASDAAADLNMTVFVKSRNGVALHTSQVIAQGTEPNIQVMSGDNARLALDRALANGMRSLFEDQAFLAALMAARR